MPYEWISVGPITLNKISNFREFCSSFIWHSPRESRFHCTSEKYVIPRYFRKVCQNYMFCTMFKEYVLQIKNPSTLNVKYYLIHAKDICRFELMNFFVYRTDFVSTAKYTSYVHTYLYNTHICGILCI